MVRAHPTSRMARLQRWSRGPEVGLISRVTQGCQPIGPARNITQAQRNLVVTLDGKGRAFRSAFDHLLRVMLGRKADIVLSGGPNFLEQVEHKLRAYTWNVVYRYEVELVIDVREIGPDCGGQRALFSSRKQFAREADASFERSDDVVHDEATFRVRGRFVDHDIPCVAYVIEEKARVKLAKDQLAALGVSAGAWLRELKHAVLTGAPEETPIRVLWRDRHGEHAMTRQVGELRHLILAIVPGRRIGYVTDLRYTESNIAAVSQLMHDVDLLFIESVFLDEDRAHGLRKNHLTAHQAGLVARRIAARAVVPFHFSPRYEGRSAELIAEVQAAWSGTSALPGQRPG